MVTISIGSGNKADVQFLFAEDILGYENMELPRHAKSYRNFKKVFDNIQKERVKAFKEYKNEVTKQIFPSKSNIIDIDEVELKKFKNFLNEVT